MDKSRRQPLLGISGGLLVFVGITLGAFALFLMGEASVALGADLTNADKWSLKFLNILCMIFFAEGVYYIFAGFYGAFKFGDFDASENIVKYGKIITCSGAFNLVAMLIMTKFKINPLVDFTVGMPILFGAFYLLAAMKNDKNLKKLLKEKELENTRDEDDEEDIFL